MYLRRGLSRRGCWLLVCLGALVWISGCDSPSDEARAETVPYPISVMLPTYSSGQQPDGNSPVVQRLEEYTNTDIELIWYPVSMYDDKVKITFSSLKMPSIMVISNKSPEFVNAVRKGLLWELGPHLKKYPNLSQAHDTVLQNTSVDGKVYSVYRARELGRYGVTIRKDWLRHVGLDTPRTIDEFYEVLRAFTHNDPDGDGLADTYGMVATTFPSTFDVIQTWFGVPNKWGVGGDGRLIPAHLTKEYKESLAFLRKLYSEGLINPDFAVKDPKTWRDSLVNGEAGVLVDVADQAQRAAHEVEKSYGLTDVVDVFPGVAGPKGLRLPSTSGYDGMLAVSKSAVETEEELHRVLDFLDKLNDEEMQVLLYNGIRGRHFQKTADHKNKDLKFEMDNLKQMLMYIPEERIVITSGETPIRSKVNEVIQANEALLLNNPAEALISDTYMKKGALLDTLIIDARTGYIIGQLDDAGWEKAIQAWRDSGGDDYLKEVNEQYSLVKALSKGSSYFSP
jgi:putative aldouronate transport system substrate-binding protein